jgi:hypothetical protein
LGKRIRGDSHADFQANKLSYADELREKAIAMQLRAMGENDPQRREELSALASEYEKRAAAIERGTKFIRPMNENRRRVHTPRPRV